jgi:hypothetical protein
VKLTEPFVHVDDFDNGVIGRGLIGLVGGCLIHESYFPVMIAVG